MNRKEDGNSEIHDEKNSDSELDKRIQREREGRRRKRNKKAGT